MNRLALTAEIEAALSLRSTADWLPILEAADLICANVASYEDLMQSPQLETAGIMTTIDHAGSELTMPGFSVGGTAGAVRFPPPRQGEHNELLQRTDPWSEAD